MESKKSRWFRLQSGQAMSEYWVTIPGSIIIMLAAAALVQFIISGFTATVSGLKRTGDLNCNTSPEEKKEGPETAHTECYDVQLVASSYDSKTNRTTVGYRITSTCGTKIPDQCTPDPNDKEPKTTICHKAGKASGPANSVVLSLPAAALSAHLDEHGTPLAGHEEDFVITSQADLEACFAEANSNPKKGGPGNKPAIDYWTLGIPSNVTSKIVSASESYSTGGGIKFDSYSTCNNIKPSGLGVCHIAGLAKSPSNFHLMENMPLSAYRGHIDEHGTQQAGHEQDFIIYTEEDRQRCLAGPADKKTQSFLSLTNLSSEDPLSPIAQTSSSDSRTVLLTIDGHFDWGIVDLGIQYGTTVDYGQITAPIVESDAPSDDKCGANK